MSWSAITVTPNYGIEYHREFPTEIADDNILLAFTQYHARIYEQALLSYFKPSLTGNYVVTFPFENWQLGDSVGKAVAITAIDLDGERYGFTSRNQASQITMVDRKTLAVVANYTEQWTFSSVFGPIRFEELGKPLIEGKAIWPSSFKGEPITGYDLFSIPHGEIRAVVTHDHGGSFKTLEAFSSCAEAARSLNLPGEHTVQRVVNRWATVACTLAGTLYHLNFVKNPHNIHAGTPIVRIDLLNPNTRPVMYPSLPSLCRELNQPEERSSYFYKEFLKNHINQGIPYADYKFMRYSNYVGPKPLTVYDPNASVLRESARRKGK
jgi:hypothetical protein